MTRTVLSGGRVFDGTGAAIADKVCTSGGVLSPRGNPRHAHSRPDELDALVAEATAAGLPVMAHAVFQGGRRVRGAIGDQVRP